MGSGLQLRALRRDGSEFAVEVSLSPLQTAGGKLISAAIRDVSERNAAEAARAQLAAVVESSTDAIISKTLDGTIVSWNPGAHRLYGYSEAEAIGQPISMLRPPGQEEEIPRLLSRLAAGQSVDVFEGVRRRKDGSLVSVSITTSAIRDSRGTVVGAAMIARDVSERRQMEDELRASREQALTASRLKSEFVANMSHEIRTPLNGVVCMSELLLDTRLSPEQREYAQVALTSAEALMLVINDILDFSKMEAGKLDIVYEDYAIDAAVSAVCEIVGGKAHEKSLELVFSVDPDVLEVVRGDANRVRQVLLNLLSNAVKFTARGTVLVGVARERDGKGAERLRVEVSDTGMGIQPERLDDLFEPFLQGDSTPTRSYGGTGLGLCIAKQLIDLMGGEIGVRSTPGKGSTFWFVIPCERGTAVESERPVRDLTGARVLIVDDNETGRHILLRQMAHWGVIPDSAAGGQLALELMHRAADAGRAYEAAVIDMRMPGMDGLELARTIKATPRLRSTRLIMLSSAPVRSIDVRAAGIDVDLAKPVR